MAGGIKFWKHQPNTSEDEEILITLKFYILVNEESLILNKN
jgi:hypothetical protein